LVITGFGDGGQVFRTDYDFVRGAGFPGIADYQLDGIIAVFIGGDGGIDAGGIGYSSVTIEGFLDQGPEIGNGIAVIVPALGTVEGYGDIEVDYFFIITGGGNRGRVDGVEGNLGGKISPGKNATKIRLKVYIKSILPPKQTHPGCFAAPATISQEGNLRTQYFVLNYRH